MLNKKVEIEFTQHGTHNLFGKIWPGKKVTTNKAIAEKQIRNGTAKYPGEAPAETEDDETDADEGLNSKTVKELKDKLDDLGVEYSSGDKKADLIALIEDAEDSADDETEE